MYSVANARPLRCELYRDNFQNYKRYGIPKAQLVIADIPYCYDEETECWTTKGWKKYDEITEEDIVLSLDYETLEMSYSGIERIIIKDNDEKMYKFQSKDMDLFVTENHRMLSWYSYNTRTYGGKRVRKLKKKVRLAKEISSLSFVPRSGYKYKNDPDRKLEYFTIPGCEINTNGQEHRKDDKKIPIDTWLKFFGLWLADGCTVNSKGNNGRQLYTVSIKQAGEKREQVRELIKEFPFTIHEYKNKGTDKSNFNIYSKQLWLYLEQFGKSKDKFIPRELLDLPVEKLKILWDWYTFGDSTRNGKGLQISSMSKELTGNLQEIALKLGCICQIREEELKSGKTLYYFQYNHNSKNIKYSNPEIINKYNKKGLVHNP